MEKREKRYNFLVIEDSRGDFVLVDEYLNDQFASPVITHAATFREAQAAFADGSKNRFDCIILDLSLPDKSGDDLIKEIIQRANNTPIVVLTGFSDLTYSVNSLGIGVSDYLLKDEVSPALLYKSIIYSIKRSQFAEKLKASEKKYRELFELSPEPMWLVDTITNEFLEVNKASVKQYGFSKDEFLSMRADDIKIEEVKTVSDTVKNGALNSESVSGEHYLKHRKKDGEVINVEIETNHITYKEKNARIVLAKDVTEKLREEERQRLFESVIKNSTEAVIIFDVVEKRHESRIIYVNEGFSDITGYRFDEAKARTIDFLHGEETDSEEVQKIRNALFNREPCEVELVCYKKDCSTFWMQTLIVPVANHENKIKHMVAIGRDITLRKHTDEHLKKSLQEKEILLAEIHHRIKNNLALVSGMLQMQAFDEENEEVLNKLNNSMLRVETMASIHQLLYESSSFSKLEFSKIVNKLVKATHNSFSTNKDIEIEIETDPFELNIDQAVPCSLIINEVITNVYKHAFKGRESGWVKAKLYSDGEEVTFTIEDDGVGLPEGFDMTQLSSLGTKIITALVKQLHGTYELARREEGGTIFQLMFPIKKKLKEHAVPA